MFVKQNVYNLYPLIVSIIIYYLYYYIFGENPPVFFSPLVPVNTGSQMSDIVMARVERLRKILYLN